MGRYSKAEDRKKLHPALVAVIDVLLGAVFLGIFVFFHLVLPILTARSVSVALPVPTTEPEMTAAPTQTPTQPETTAAPTEETLPDNRTEWQIKFADHFTDKVIWTDHSYSSPNVSIYVETITVEDGPRPIVYHVADIYVGSLDNFCTYTANNELKYYSTQDAMEMDAASGALVAISGDFYAYQQSGFLVRNGEAYSLSRAYCDVCVMFYDGSIEMYPSGKLDIDELTERGVYQAWNFGPSLLDENGEPYPSYQVSTAVSYPNPRSAIGYYEPGHYCFVVVDGRQDGYSKGMTIPELAKLFQDLGCVSAYNLDGGGSALMTFNHERYSQQSNGADRKLGDILLIRETEE